MLALEALGFTRAAADKAAETAAAIMATAGEKDDAGDAGESAAMVVSDIVSDLN